ncbi:MAG: hypothetical protein QNJ91_09425 [Gammaproteobacteria bacterium]|nr:hypothetical protein [Gammaproteobacteria bacterium]
MKPSSELDRRLHVVADSATGDLTPASQPPQLQADWQRICDDMTRFGLVRVTVANPVAELTCLCEAWSVDGSDGEIGVHGPGLQLRTWTDRLATATLDNGSGQAPGERTLRWLDWYGGEQLRVALTDESRWSCLRSLLIRQWAQPAVPRAVGHSAAARGPGRRRARPEQGPRRRQGQSPALDDRRRRPAAAGGCRGGCQAFDRALVAPFLDALAENASGIALGVQNDAVQLRHDTDFYRCDIAGDCLELNGSTATLALRRDALAFAEVVDSGDAPRHVRLLDAQRRVAATLWPSAAPGADTALWQALVNALRS